MKRKKLFIALVIAPAVGVVVIIGLLAYFQLRPHYATSFENAGGWVYTCSRPVRVKDQGVKYGNGKPSLTPVNQNDTAKYCQRTGME